MKNRYIAGMIWLLLIVGCRSSPRRVIVAIPIATADSVYVVEHAGLVHEAENHSLSVYWNGPGGEGNVSRQVELVENAIRQNNYGIVISPAARFALNTVIQNAVLHGIPVVILGPSLELAPSRELSYVSMDMDRMGSLAAQRIAQTTEPDAEIAIAGVDPMVPGAVDCAHAFESSLSKLAPHARIVSRMAGSLSWSQSKIAMKRSLEEHPG
jgi:ABC-type sugar transport system substrate-binding protein